MRMIDTTLDFTTDTPGYWDGFWDRCYGHGGGNTDPDSDSLMLQEYHRILWSRDLPNGERMELKAGYGSGYLSWQNHRFGSDSIIVSFRYKRYLDMLDNVAKMVPDYHSFVENYVRRSYTIGGMIIFPKHNGSINQRRGCNRMICDRMDLTLECIRRFYVNQESPLSSTLESDRNFFRLFLDFKGYVDFFFLQDWVDSKYEPIIFGDWNGEFYDNPLPKTPEEYLQWIDFEMDLLDKRNRRIDAWQATLMDQKTLDYYNQNAETFVEGTVSVEFTKTQDRFLKMLPAGSRILDFGCGSGRDTKYFLSKGFLVDATDGSEELCRIASELTGISIRQMLFTELDAVDVYDGIWACSSILHCPKEELRDVLWKMIRATKDGGVIYTSFKYGDFEGERNGRYFTYFTTEAFHEFMLEFPKLSIEQEWVSVDVRLERGNERWLNLILRKSNTI